jgi:hypothetical protein
VARVDAQLTHDAGQHHELGFTRVDGFFRADDIDLNGGHICSSD